MGKETSIKVLRTVSELEEIRAAWESWPGGRDSDMGLFLEVLGSIPGAVRPHVIVVYSDEQPDAILIGRIDSSKFPLRVGYWRFGGPQVRLLTFVVGAQRGNPSPQASELLLREALSSLRRQEADVVRLAGVPVDSALHDLAARLPGLLARDYGATSKPHWLMDLPKSYDDVLRALSGDLRKQLKRNAKRIEADIGHIELRRFDRAEELEAMVSDVECIAAMSHLRGIGGGFHDTPFKRKMLQFEAARGWLLGYVLYAGGKPGAFWLGSLYDGVFYSDYMAYDPSLGRYSPGTLLQAKVLEDLCGANRIRSIDLGTGDFLYKQRLGTIRYEESDIYMYPSTVRGFALNSARSLSVLANEMLKAALHRLGMLSRVKAAWGKRPESLRRKNAATKGITEGT